MALQTYETHELVGVINTFHDANQYWLDLLFPQARQFDSEFIDFDVVSRGRRLAPFVSPMAQGKPMLEQGHTTKRFKPAYLKPKNIVDPTRVLRRRAGEPYMGTWTPAQRYNAIIADILVEHRLMHKRRQEWMAANAIINGSVVVSGENYPTVTVDFGRDAGQTVTLVGAALWTDPASDPLGNIDTWLTQTQRLSGYAPNRITMGTAAWNAFRAREDVKLALDTRRGSATKLETAIGTGEIAQYKGTLGASLEVWTYSDIFENDAGTAVEMMDDGDVVLSSSGVDGVRCFGAILDAKAGFAPMEMFPKMWVNEDPSVTFLMTQSAPLMVPTRPNAILKARVA